MKKILFYISPVENHVKPFVKPVIYSPEQACQGKRAKAAVFFKKGCSQIITFENIQQQIAVQGEHAVLDPERAAIKRPRKRFDVVRESADIFVNIRIWQDF